MTTLRRQRLSRRFALSALLLAAAVPGLLWHGGHAAAAERIAASGGVAIRGYDPVAYFNDHAATPGRSDYEFKYGGATWRFASRENRDAFADEPDTFIPQYGGHDPIAISDNVARAGQPDLFAIHNERLFLFASPSARDAFLADPDTLAMQAEVNWPHVSEAGGQ